MNGPILYENLKPFHTVTFDECNRIAKRADFKWPIFGSYVCRHQVNKLHFPLLYNQRSILAHWISSLCDILKHLRDDYPYHLISKALLLPFTSVVSCSTKFFSALFIPARFHYEIPGSWNCKPLTCWNTFGVFRQVNGKHCYFSVKWVWRVALNLVN